MNAEKLIRFYVESVLQAHEGGTKFFDTLDALLTNVVLFDYLRDRILGDGPAPFNILTSGKFGWAFSVYAQPIPALPPVINFPGNLRHEKLQETTIDPMFRDREFVFIDNSVYKGRTVGQINEYVERWGGKITRAYILYDGSRPPYSWTKTGFKYDYLYRWHEGGFIP